VPAKRKKSPAAAALGKLRQAKLTKEQRRKLGRKGMASRWGTKKRSGSKRKKT